MEYKTTPYLDQKAGTSGLRKTTKTFLENKFYLENYLQAIFNVMGIEGKKIFCGGDGRFFNLEAIEIFMQMAIAQGAKEVIVAKGGFSSTPASSVVNIKYGVDFGVIFSASHNKGGINGDFGIKIHNNKGAPLGDDINKAIYAESQKITSLQISSAELPDINTLNVVVVKNTKIKIIDSVLEYRDYISTIFDLHELRDYIRKEKIKIFFDGMYSISSLYVKSIFQEVLEVDAQNFIRTEVKSDFGGLSPEPTPENSTMLLEMLRQKKGDLAFSNDADLDRNFIMSQNDFLYPSDALAIIVANHALVSRYKKISGVARSFVTSSAVDLVCQDLGINCYKVPTGWKYFFNLLQGKKIDFCGEESFGIGSSHLPEKDGIWAVLFVLTIMMKKQCSLEQVITDHHKKYGITLFTRVDNSFTIDETTIILSKIKQKAQFLQDNGTEILGMKVLNNKVEDYNDIETGEYVQDVCYLINFSDNFKAMFRISGTSTVSSVIRMYNEKRVAYGEKIANTQEKFDDFCKVLFRELSK